MSNGSPPPPPPAWSVESVICDCKVYRFFLKLQTSWQLLQESFGSFVRIYKSVCAFTFDSAAGDGLQGGFSSCLRRQSTVLEEVALFTVFTRRGQSPVGGWWWMKYRSFTGRFGGRKRGTNGKEHKETSKWHRQSFKAELKDIRNSTSSSSWQCIPSMGKFSILSDQYKSHHDEDQIAWLPNWNGPHTTKKKLRRWFRICLVNRKSNWMDTLRKLGGSWAGK